MPEIDQLSDNRTIESTKPRETLIVDATMISTFRSCEEKYNKRMEQYLVSKFNNGAIGSGLAYHEGGAAFRQARKSGLSLEEAYNVGLFKLRDSYPKFMPVEFISGPIPDERRSLPNLERIFEAWCLYEAKQNFKYLYVEQSGGISLGSIERSDRIYDIIYSIIIDAIVEMQGCVFVDDIKTTTMNITQAYKDSFRLSQQIMGYTIAAAELLKQPIYGGMISVVWFQKEAKSGKGKPVEEYFHTVPITFTKSQQDEWHTNTLRTVNKILDARESGEWQMDLGDSCKAYNGCTYKQVCWSSPELREGIIKMDFEKATWTPLEEIRSRKIELDD
jgi:PD-(D/E)XK nuclease superfamily protein